MDTCKCCGFPVQDGRQLCPVCDGTSPHPDVILEDGTPLYLKMPANPTWGSIQLELYQKLFSHEQENKEN